MSGISHNFLRFVHTPSVVDRLNGWQCKPDYFGCAKVVTTGAAALSSRTLIVFAPVDLPGLRARSALFTYVP